MTAWNYKKQERKIENLYKKARCEQKSAKGKQILCKKNVR